MRINDKFIKNNLDKLFFTSDPHFFHEGIIKFSKRPFKDVKDQTNTLISNWNEVVPHDGIVFMLGDFAWTGNIDSIQDILDQLNGTIYWIMGNHDYQNKLDRKIISNMVGDRQMDVATIITEDPDFPWNIFCSHYPHMFWQRGSIHLHGHVHGGPNSTNSEKVPPHKLRYDVGVDNCNYYPISYNEIKQKVLDYVEEIK